jgi:peptidoglycan/LPS O-acetylase OafA/YrhL
MQGAPGHRFRSLDSLRGIAAVIVVLHHLMLAVPEASQGHFRLLDLPLSLGGRFAVMLFFVLSGFVLALPYFADKHLAYGRYLVRRFCRLYPPFAFAVLISAFLCWSLGGKSLPMVSSWLNDPWSNAVTTSVVMSHLLMEGIGKSQSIDLDSPIWSLIIEMRVSFVFPLLVDYVRRFEWPGVKGGVKVDQCGGAKGSHLDTEKHVEECGARASGA